MTEDLTSIDGVGPAIADQLREAGFETVDDVQGADVGELADVHLIGAASAEAILGGDDDAHGGRPSKLDDVRDDLLEAAERGTTKEGCARAAGIATSTLYDWLDQFPEFSEAFNRARGVRLKAPVAIKRDRLTRERDGKAGIAVRVGRDAGVAIPRHGYGPLSPSTRMRTSPTSVPAVGSVPSLF